MNVKAGSLVGLMVGLSLTPSLWAHGQKVHAWIANEAAKLYEAQYGDHELMKYLGDNVESPSDARELIADWLEIGCDPTDEKSSTGLTFMEGAWEEDTVGVWMAHFVAGGDTDELQTGLTFAGITYPSAYARAPLLWNGAMYTPPKKTVLGEYLQNKPLAYYYLGRIAHLVADMTVPAHTHNDAHAIDKDFYEYTTSQYDLHTLYGAETGRSKPRGPIPLYDNLQDLFGTTADYTEGYRSWGYIGGYTLWAQWAGSPGDYSVSIGIPNKYGGFLDTALLAGRYRPYVVNDLTGDQLRQVADTAYFVMADDLMPFAIEQTAALIRLFYKQVDNSASASGWSWSWTSNIPSSDPAIPMSVPPGTLTITMTAEHPSGVAKNKYSFAVRRKQGSTWVSASVGIPLTDQPDTITLPSLSAGTYEVEATAVNGVDRTGSIKRYFCNADVSTPSTNWQAALSLGLIEGERSWSNVYLAPGDVHYYRFTIGAAGRDSDYVEIWMKGNGTGSNNLDVALGKVSGGAFRPATGKWGNVCSFFKDTSPKDDKRDGLSLKGFGPREYYVVVYGSSGLDSDEDVSDTNVNFAGTESGEYSLSIHAPMLDAYEVDDTAGSASSIQTNGTLHHHSLPGSDIDWVKFQLYQLSEIDVTTAVVLGDLSTNDLGLRISLFGPEASDLSIVTNYDDKGNARISRRGDNSLVPGTYYVKVESDTANDIRHYTLGVTATPRVLPNQSPIIPSGMSPVDGATGVWMTPTLQSSSFMDFNPSDAHRASQWQVSKATDFSSRVWDSEETMTDKTSVTVPAGQLDYVTTYYWRVRHQDSSGVANSWSDWSAPLSFTTLAEVTTYTISVSSSPADGGTVSGGGPYNSGDPVTAAAKANSGYVFANWTENGQEISASDTYTFAPDKDHDLTANFTPLSCTLAVSPDTRAVSHAAGSTSFSVSNSGSGTMNWTAQVISGESWLSISSESSGTNSGTISASYIDNTGASSRTGTIRVAASGTSGSPKDVTVTQSAGCTLSASVVGGHGSVSPSHQTCDYGQPVSLSATPDTGYGVKAWAGTDNDSSTANTNTVTMNGDKTVTVQFLPTAATLAISMVASANPVKAKDQVTYTITYGNAGQPSASNAVITEILPTGVSFVNASGGGAYSTAARTITWNLGTLAGQMTGQTVSFIVTVDDSVADGGTIGHNQLTIKCDQASPVTAAAVTTTVSDTKPPQLSEHTPAVKAEMVPRTGVIRLHVTDRGSGVDYQKVSIVIPGPYIHDTYVYDGAHETSDGVYDGTSVPGSVPGVCRRTGTPADYEFTFTPTADCFDYEQEVMVVVDASDKAGNNRREGWSFTTETRSFGNNARVNSDTGKVTHDHPATAVDSTGNTWVVWDQQTAAGDTDIYIGKLAVGGTAFGASVAVCQAAGIQSYPVIAIDGNNQLYVAWQSQGSNGRWDVYGACSSNGVSWSTPVVVNVGDSKNTSSQMYPSIAYDGRNPGTIYVAYEDDRAGNKDIWVAASTNGAAWTETRITTESTDQTQPNIFMTVLDGVPYEPMVVWTDARWSAQTTHIMGASRGESWKSFLIATGTIAQSHAVGVAYLLAWVFDDGALTNICYGSIPARLQAAADVGAIPMMGTGIADKDEPNIRQAAPSLATNADGEVFAAWQDSRNVKNNSDTDIYFAERSLAGAFGTNVLVNDDTGTNAQSAPAIGADHNGDPYIVWVDDRNANKDIYYAGAVSIRDPVSTTIVTNGTTVTVKAMAQANLQVEIPQMPSGTSAEEITISEVGNPPQMPAGTNAVGSKYEFGPPGLQFATPVTIRIPLTQDGSYDSYRVYRYDPSDLTSPLAPWTESGIHNPAMKVTVAGGAYLQVQVDHFSIYGAAGVTVPPPPTPGSGDGGSGGSGGGGCALSPYRGCHPLEFALPFVGYLLVLFGVTLVDRRRHCK